MGVTCSVTNLIEIIYLPTIHPLLIYWLDKKREKKRDYLIIIFLIRVKKLCGIFNRCPHPRYVFSGGPKEEGKKTLFFFLSFYITITNKRNLLLLLFLMQYKCPEEHLQSTSTYKMTGVDPQGRCLLLRCCCLPTAGGTVVYKCATSLSHHPTNPRVITHAHSLSLSLQSTSVCTQQVR